MGRTVKPLQISGCPPPPGCNTAGSEGVKQNRACWGSNPTADVLPGESPVFFPLHSSSAVRHVPTCRWGRSTPRLRQPTLSCSTCSCRFSVVPKVSQHRPLRHPDTELQMGGIGPRQLVSQCGLEFTVGIKYETNMSLYICFLQFVHPAVSLLAPPPFFLLRLSCLINLCRVD